MNRRQKIIISVTGIFLVLLILVGLTYAYFLTQIQGNENDKSITVTTANLRLVYTDGNGVLTPAEMLLPGNTVKFKDKDNNIVESKTFAVTNEGDTKTDYVVVIEDVKVTNATTNATTTFESNDFRYTITCTNGTTECNGVKTEVFPMNGGIVVGNNINVGETQTYTLTMEYLETNEDQSNDMNKTLSAKINIKDIRSINPYSDNKDSLAYNIINNSMLAKNGTKLVATPPSKVAEEGSSDNWDLGVEEKIYLNNEYGIKYYAETEEALWLCQDGVFDEEIMDWVPDCSGVTEYTSCTDDVKGKYVFTEDLFIYYVKDCENGKIVIGTPKYERVLSTTIDDLGISYYYRGAVEDNYVNFAGMCWKIVRIQGDGSIKLILEDQYTTCDDNETTNSEEIYTGNWIIGTGNYGYELKNVDSDSKNESIMNYLRPVTNNTSSMIKAFYDFQTNKLSNYLNDLKSGDWCLGDKAYTRSGSSGSYTYTPLEEYNYLGEMYYDSYVRLSGDNINGYQPTLRCNGTILNEFADVGGVSSKAPMYVSALTADEVTYAGSKYRDGQHNIYLNNDYSGYKFYTLSASYYLIKGENSGAQYGDFIFMVSNDGSLGQGSPDDGYVYNVDAAFRPSIILSQSVTITGGEGTIKSPYVID